MGHPGRRHRYRAAGGKTRIYNPDGILSTTGNTAVAQDSSANVKTQVFNVSTPVDMLGKAVTMYVKKTTILADSTVYGAPVVSDVNTVIETGEKVTGGDSKDDDSLAALLKGTGLATDKATEYYHNYEEVAIDSADVDDIMNVKGAALTVIDDDNDGYVNYVISVEKSLTMCPASAPRTRPPPCTACPATMSSTTRIS